MSAYSIIKKLLVVTLLCSSLLRLVAENKKKEKKIQEIATSDGHYYSNIKALIPKADVLVIITAKGEHEVDYRKLPPEIQKRYKYNPAKAAIARKKKAAKQQKELKRAEQKNKQYKAHYKLILEDGELYVVIKKFTLVRHYGGFIHVKKLKVIPVDDSKTAFKGEIFKVNLKNLTSLKSYTEELVNRQNILKKELTLLPQNIAALQKAQTDATEKVASLMATAKQYIVQNGNSNIPQTVRYDPVIMKQVNILKKQLKQIKKQLKALKKRDPEDIKTELRQANKTLATIEKNSYHYVIRRRLKEEKQNISQQKTPPKKAPESSPKASKTEDAKVKLKALKEMFKADLITKEEYKKKKQEILSSF